MLLRPRLTLLLVLALAPPTGIGQPETPRPGGAAPTRADVRQALDTLKNDPNLAAERAVNMLRRTRPEPVPDEPWWWQWANALGRWLRGLFSWLAESGRYVVWVLGALLAVLLVVYLTRLVRVRGVPSVAKRQRAAPSHVRDLDIRPESLPDDVGSAALALWRTADQRAALALLYRGSLSRLVHVHGVPIRASSTEGECVALARPRLTERGAGYFARLVGTWGEAVYGGLPPTTSAVEALCGEFAAALERAPGAA